MQNSLEIIIILMCVGFAICTASTLHTRLLHVSETQSSHAIVITFMQEQDTSAMTISYSSLIEHSSFFERPFPRISLKAPQASHVMGGPCARSLPQLPQ